MFPPSCPRRFLLASLVAALALAPAGCREQAPPPAPAPLKTIADHFPIRVGSETVQMEIALTPGEQQRGLMERGKLGDNEGMIFVESPVPHRLTYWMHDCPTPLDIGYFAPNGQLAEIYPLLPFDERTVASRRPDLQFALEMNQGWYSAHGVRPGNQVDLKALAAAVRARGFDPKNYGL